MSLSLVVCNPRVAPNRDRASRFYEYQVQTLRGGVAEEDEQSIYRRFRDFEWLHRQVSFDCPGVILPGLPEKGLGTLAAQLAGDANVDKPILKERARLLTVLLNGLLTNPEVVAEPTAVKHFRKFLTATQEELDLMKSPNTNLDAEVPVEVPKVQPRRSRFSFKMPESTADVTAAFKSMTVREEPPPKTPDDERMDRMLDNTNAVLGQLEGAEKMMTDLVQRGVDLGRDTEAFGLALIGMGRGDCFNEDAIMSAAATPAGAPNQTPVGEVVAQLGTHLSTGSTAALYDRCHRQVVALLEPIRSHIRTMKSIKAAIVAREHLRKRLLVLKANHKTATATLQRAYDSGKTTEDRRVELERRADVAQEEVDAAEAALSKATARLTREHVRTTRERIWATKDALHVWAKLHEVHAQQWQQDWQILHENLTNRPFERRMPVPPPTAPFPAAPVEPGAPAVAAEEGPAPLPQAADAPAASPNFEGDEVAV